MDMNLNGNKLTVSEKQLLSHLAKYSSADEVRSIRELIKVSLNEVVSSNMNHTYEKPQLITSVAATFGDLLSVKLEERKAPFRNLDELITQTQLKELAPLVDVMDGKWKFTDTTIKQPEFYIKTKTQFADVVLSSVLSYVYEHSDKFQRRLKESEEQPSDFEVMICEFIMDPTYSKGFVVFKTLKFSFRTGFLSPSCSETLVYEILDPERLKEKSKDDIEMDYSNDQSEVIEYDDYDDYER